MRLEHLRARGTAALLAAALLALLAPAALLAAPGWREISLAEYRDKMKAGWLGQMAGVGQGGPTEFRWKGKIIPEEKMPSWKPDLVNQFNQDDIYVEMTFVRSLEEHGLGVSIRQAGIDWANSGYRLWHANRAGRDNLRRGIAPPDSGHPKFNSHADDIDYQIEADFSGLVAPGLPQTAIELGEKFGRLMNYGDGLYGGQFVGGMYAEAFFEKDPEAIVGAGLACIPRESQYAEAIRDVLGWHRESPRDWKAAWERIEAKFHDDPAHRKFSCSGPESDFDIDAKLNGAYIVMGLLYGERDPDRTIRIATRCGQDSDCNPASAAGVLFTTVGFESLPERYRSALDRAGVFSHTAYNFPRLIRACEKIAREAVREQGGEIVRRDGEERFRMPARAPRPSRFAQCWAPGPIAGSRFSDAEMSRIGTSSSVAEAVEKFAPGWKISRCGEDMDPGLRPEARGRKNVLLTHPLDRDTGCVLSRTVSLPAGKKSTLHLVVGHDPRGDWTLVVRADGEEILEQPIGEETTTDGWRTVEVDLSRKAGRSVRLELVNQPSGWRYEAGLWAEIAIRSE